MENKTLQDLENNKINKKIWYLFDILIGDVNEYSIYQSINPFTKINYATM